MSKGNPNPHRPEANHPFRRRVGYDHKPKGGYFAITREGTGGGHRETVKTSFDEMLAVAKSKQALRP